MKLMNPPRPPAAGRRAAHPVAVHPGPPGAPSGTGRPTGHPAPPGGTPTAVVDCHVWLSRVPAEPVLRFELLDEVERARCSRFVNGRDLALFVTGRTLAKSAVGLLAGVAPEEVSLRALCPDCGGPHGKPWVEGKAAGWELSLSHSRDVVAVAVAYGHAVGVDVEYFVPQALPGVPAEYELVLTPAERLMVESLPIERQASACLTLWTRKEAVLKATGEGLNTSMESFTVSPASAPPELIAWHGPTASDRPALALADLPRLGDCHGALAVTGARTAALRVHTGSELAPGSALAARPAVPAP
ncbi:4'-phosphopantetheinyl transferase family protein [Streptomyces sp. NPDC093225]|uniref:4'-phosphopantetheinyl transferase family protein n=1 Tax=Streptomyces sp. NPDC093225 TaxID=3366034 RepID=UPI00380FB9DA